MLGGIIPQDTPAWFTVTRGAFQLGGAKCSFSSELRKLSLSFVYENGSSVPHANEQTNQLKLISGGKAMENTLRMYL